VAERVGGFPGVQKVDEGDELPAEGRVGVGAADRRLAVCAAEMEGAEGGAPVIYHGQRDLRAGLVGEVGDLQAGGGFEPDGSEARAEQAEDGFERVDAVIFPGLGAGAGDPAQGPEVGMAAEIGIEFRRIAHAAGGKQARAGFFPRDEGAQIFEAGGEGFVHEDGQSGLDEGPGAAHVVEAVIGRDEYGVHVADDVLWFLDDVRNFRGGGGERRLGGIVRPQMRDAGAGNADRFRRVRAHIFGDAGIGALRECDGIVAVDDRRPGERVTVARDHPEHGEAQRLVRVRHGDRRSARGRRQRRRRRGRRG